MSIRLQIKLLWKGTNKR